MIAKKKIAIKHDARKISLFRNKTLRVKKLERPEDNCAEESRTIEKGKVVQFLNTYNPAKRAKIVAISQIHSRYCRNVRHITF